MICSINVSAQKYIKVLTFLKKMLRFENFTFFQVPVHAVIHHSFFKNFYNEM